MTLQDFIGLDYEFQQKATASITSAENVLNTFSQDFLLQRTTDIPRPTIYISSTGDDNNDGLTNLTPIATWDRLYDIATELSGTSPWLGISISGTLTLTRTLVFSRNNFNFTHIKVKGGTLVFDNATTETRWAYDFLQSLIYIGNRFDFPVTEQRSSNSENFTVTFEDVDISFIGDGKAHTIITSNATFIMNDGSLPSRSGIGGYHIYLIYSDFISLDTITYKGEADSFFRAEVSSIYIEDNISNGGAGADPLPYNFPDGIVSLFESTFIDITSTPFSFTNPGGSSNFTGKRYNLGGNCNISSINPDFEAIFPGTVAGTRSGSLVYNNNPFLSGPFADDTAAASGGVNIGQPYYQASGAVVVRLS